ncbi:MAG TPA: hypothetical protein VEU29_02435, partial [Actinomycetota bacterium]|nr:hypothetical protein [Actinomycetota bacterium]
DDPAAFRAIELTNGGRFPTKETLAMWDELLVQGYEVWGVGGSDAHSRSVDVRDLLHGGPGLANLGKIGVSRTYAFVPEDLAPVEGYDATDPDDPVRRAIYSGGVVASNGPRALAVIGDAGPGETATIPPGEVTVQVGILWPLAFSSEHPHPDRVRLTYSKIAPGCGDACPRALVVERDAPADSHVMTVPLALPAEWERAYVRVEVVADDDKPLGAFVSPIFIERSAAASAS